MNSEYSKNKPEIGKGELLLVYDKVKVDADGAGRKSENCYVGSTNITIKRFN